LQKLLLLYQQIINQQKQKLQEQISKTSVD